MRARTPRRCVEATERGTAEPDPNVRCVVAQCSEVACGRGNPAYRLHYVFLAVHADMLPQAKVPLMAFSGLPHRRVALFLLVLGRRRRMDNRASTIMPVAILLPLVARC
jgi:hypothetical protein